MKKDPSKTYCDFCGQELASGERHETVTRIVRAGNKYGVAGPGQRVEVEPRFLAGPALAATMSVEEADMLAAHKAEKRAAPVGRLKQMVEMGLESVVAATRSQIEQGRERLKRNAERAAVQAAISANE